MKKKDAPMFRRVRRLMVDSGAFSVWSNGASIDLQAYIDFCKAHSDTVDVFIALDVIPGSKSSKTPPSQAERDAACEEGWLNYEKMVEAGVPSEKVTPVFHQYDDFKWLRKMVDAKIPYISLATIKKGQTRHQHRAWLDCCMKYVCDKNGMPLQKWHGLGMTGVPFLIRYPWYSVDSASWIKHAAYGGIMVPHRTLHGEWNFLRTPMSVSVSTECGGRFRRGQHFETLPPAGQKLVKDYVAETGVPFGTSKVVREPLDYPLQKKEVVVHRGKSFLDVEKPVERGVCNDDKFRSRVNAYFFDRLAELLPWPRRYATKRTLL